MTDHQPARPVPIGEGHQRFTASTTAYLRNLNREEMRAETWAIHYQDPPRPGSEPGTTTFSLRFPTLIVAGYVAEAAKVAEKVAAILNKHWEDEA